jgi:hypothetical protein
MARLLARNLLLLAVCFFAVAHSLQALPSAATPSVLEGGGGYSLWERLQNWIRSEASPIRRERTNRGKCGGGIDPDGKPCPRPTCTTCG